MSRIKIFAANPRRALAALATVLVAVGITGASGADFNAQTANPTNIFTAGTLSMDNTKNNAAILTASNMRPGAPATSGEVDIKNTGSLSAPFTLSKGTLSNTDATNPLSAKLNIVVNDCGVDVDCATKSLLYTGTVAGMGSNLALGTFASNATHRYEFNVDLDGTAGNVYQGGSSTVEFVWNTTS